MVGPAFGERLDAIAWGDFRTAYGPATDVPDLLRQLAGLDRQAANDASHELWCGLCHQHVQVGSAALPALPFLLEVLDSADATLTTELLDILLGFALGVNRRRLADYRRSHGWAEVVPERQWMVDLRAGMIAELPRFRRLRALPNAEAAGFAARIVAELEEGLGPNQPLQQTAAP